MHSKHADLSNVALDIFSIIAHGVGVQASVSLGRDRIGRRQSQTTREILREHGIVRQFAGANNGLLAGDDHAIGTRITDNNSEIKGEVEKKMLDRFAKVHKILDM
jgi:hypothetical protein